MHVKGLDMSLSLLLPIIILELILVIVAITDLVRREKENVVGNNKIIWILIIVLINTIGPIIYLVFGRKK